MRNVCPWCLSPIPNKDVKKRGKGVLNAQVASYIEVFGKTSTIVDIVRSINKKYKTKYLPTCARSVQYCQAWVAFFAAEPN